MRDWLENQYQNLFLYVPFLLSFGASLYFTTTNEPDIILTACVFIVSVGISLIKHIPVLLRGLLLFIIGFCYACIYTNVIDTPKLSRNLHNLEIVGSVKSIDYTDDKTRIYLSVNAADINAGNGVANIRVTLGDRFYIPNIGDTVRANVGLFKLSVAYAPETFDYARWAYFNKLSATGYVNNINIIQHNDSVGINKLRDNIHGRANSFLVDTLVLGYKGAIPKSHSEIWTATGIGHVWSISGFHMTLVGGWIFMVFYFLFRATPYITRRTSAKIPAMCCALLGLLIYLFLSGCDVATIRAFLMTALVFGAFIFGRSAISMRNIAIVFCVVFLLNPHYVMQAGFQLSFAAVFGLVWFFTILKPQMPDNKILRIIYAAALTTIVATIFTAPFVAMHFGALPVYSLIGNMILLPVFSFIIMPLILIGTITGWGAPITFAHNVYDYLFSIADSVSKLPGAMVVTPHIPNVAIICFAIGFICLMLIRNMRIKINLILFGVFSVIGVIVVYCTPRPIFYATYDNELVAFVRDDGKLEFNKSRASNHYFAFNTWKQINGEKTGTPNKRRKHDNGIYYYGNIVYVQKFVPLMKNIEKLCKDNSVKYIVSYYDIKSEKCAHKLLRGGFVIYPNNRIKYTGVQRRWN